MPSLATHCERTADAARGARDDRDLAFEVFHLTSAFSCLGAQRRPDALATPGIYRKGHVTTPLYRHAQPDYCPETRGGRRCA